MTYINYPTGLPIQQYGWICSKCGRSNSPSTPTCFCWTGASQYPSTNPTLPWFTVSSTIGYTEQETSTADISTITYKTNAI
jgi:hypothetical protein